MKNPEIRREIPDILPPDMSFENAVLLHRHTERLDKLRPSLTFTLLLGPSAVGKSSIISTLQELSDNKFSYITPYMTRVLRTDETDKISVSHEQFEELKASGTFLAVNDLYDCRYGTPGALVEKAFDEGKMPILDFPLQEMRSLTQSAYDLLGLYIFPTSISSWKERMIQTGRNNPSRMSAGVEELTQLARAYQPHPDIDYSFLNSDLRQTAVNIYSIIRGIGKNSTD